MTGRSGYQVMRISGVKRGSWLEKRKQKAEYRIKNAEWKTEERRRKTEDG
jgi:hypothetical protein